MNLVQRSLTSLRWQVTANSMKLVVSLARWVLLARWLPIEVFGVYAAARAVVGVTQSLPNFGMRGAFLHRAPEVADESRAAGTHFTLKVATTAAWTLGMVAFALMFSTGDTRTALLWIATTAAVAHLTQTPALILERRVVHRRLALVQVVTAILTTAVSLTVGWIAWTSGHPHLALWSLLSMNVVAATVDVFLFYVWRPVWRPKLMWEASVARYFVRFGARNAFGIFLYQLLDKIDDIWTKVYLGDLALGFYSRAYTFATYPREVLARPVYKVLIGTYAEMKGDRVGLSKAFFQSSAFLVRSGFLLGGGLILIAPEFITILLTDKWLPMLDAFRLMIVFVMLDPLKATVSDLMVALGDASRPIPSRLIQLAVLVAGLFVLGVRWSIEGVAVAVNLATVVGIIILYGQARRYVDFSLRRLFLVPAAAVTAGVLTSIVATTVLDVDANDWLSAATKITVFGMVYVSILWLFERAQTRLWVDMARKMLR